ncbi:hypothetical protein SDRG_10493 [Saprolegnia diclina VS20]|uniref:Ketosynthase family 3 (KS3) domain-containing protein n=1 Tax=Saprolegnia diclina (strain VS20) TaxID=1156394 RepID=T0QDN5_SAPDV|nr:hypothetical protein SDRG_10493 [Saprolegnia diclina VS20]EQC31700.1 hypothetical protein SDRG_10493 [Saprolegnia diclina VS20]|eukprot:XP_008614707.1 hypothetical protein SDRG_10493 [Saprolegnia diclina VS20]
MLFLAMLVVVSSEGLRGLLQDGMAYLATYPSLFLLFLLFGFAVAVASSILHYRFHDANKVAAVPMACYDCEQQSKTKKTTKADVASKRTMAENVGILAMEVYFPANYIDQADLEQYDGVSAGKYTKGLAQDKMCFTGDREDVNSIALTAVKNLLEKYDIHPSQIGRLEVGTETMVDLCKSTKTVLMDLFHEHGNYDLEGVTSVNACYGGTAALFNSVAWVESRAWDGRYALVVCGDIAVYAKGPARPTCGCGAVAMLIGPNAPLVMESELRTTFSENMWDFYKPDPHSEYPTVDGKFSQSCYLKTLDDCYRRFCVKNELAGVTKNGKNFDVAANDFVIFHSPYNKLAQKGFSRIIFNDFLRNPSLPQYELLKKWHGAKLEDTYYDRDLDAAARKVSLDLWNRMVEPSCGASRAIGNCYTASVYINLACLVDTARASLHGKRIMLFSYGSGAVGSIFSLRVPRPADRLPTEAGAVPFTLERMSDSLNLVRRLDARMKRTPEEFNAHLDLREASHGLKSYTPLQSTDALFPGTYYLVKVDDKHRRTYARKALNQPLAYAALPPLAVAPPSPKPVVAAPKPMRVVVSGVGAGAPGAAGPFRADTFEKLLAGDNHIDVLGDDAKDAMLARRVVQISKKDGVTTRAPVSSADECIKLAAVLRPVDLVAQYGIPKSLVEGMDTASIAAVAAGLDALKQSGLVAGTVENGWGNWRLPDAMADSTGVLYATSFPALDAAVKEVARFHTTPTDDYEFDRKLLFRLLVLANAQIAQIVGAKGPNAQVNATCAGTTVAISMAQDWIKSGKCQRVIVVAGDIASSESLLPWIGSGFRALGAATLASTVADGAVPFDKRRNGMLLGGGAVGLVLEAESATIARGLSTPSTVHLVASQASNSAFHGASIDKEHLAHELNRFLSTIEAEHGISRAMIAAHGVYYSHETGTHASPSKSCAYSEISALRSAFGDAGLATLVIANTKGFTGHPMGVSFEDVVAVEGLKRGRIPPVVNFKIHDDNLSATPLRLSNGGAYPDVKYALRFAAGFGSQVAFTLYARTDKTM